jgi:hypothetical protein
VIASETILQTIFQVQFFTKINTFATRALLIFTAIHSLDYYPVCMVTDSHPKPYSPFGPLSKGIDALSRQPPCIPYTRASVVDDLDASTISNMAAPHSRDGAPQGKTKNLGGGQATSRGNAQVRAAITFLACSRFSCSAF